MPVPRTFARIWTINSAIVRWSTPQTRRSLSASSNGVAGTPIVPALLVSVTLLVIALAAATRSIQSSRARVEIARTEARDRFRPNSEMLQTARILLSTQTADPAMLDEGMQIGTTVLQNYGLGEDAHWIQRPGFRLLEDSEQARLRHDLGELLILMTRADSCDTRPNS